MRISLSFLDNSKKLFEMDRDLHTTHKMSLENTLLDVSSHSAQQTHKQAYTILFNYFQCRNVYENSLVMCIILRTNERE